MSSFVDKDYRSINTSGFQDFAVEVIDPPHLYSVHKFDNTLKLSSRIRDVLIANKEIYNYRQGCVDACRVSYSFLDRLTLHPFGDFGVKLKGSAVGNRFADLAFIRQAKKYEIELGQFDNYWYPGRAPTRMNSFRARPTDEGDLQVRVILWDADETNAFSFPNLKITRVPKFVWFPYFLLRYAQLRATNFIRKLAGKPVIPTK